MRKALRVTAIVITSLLLLVMLAMLWLTTNSGKNFLRLRAISFLEKKLNTDVHIARLDYKLPERVELWGVFFEDQKNDTILAARRMRVDIDMFKLLANQVEVNEIQIEGAISHLYRTAPDTAFNFDYVVKAFAAPPNPQAQDAPTDSTGQLKLNIHRLMLNDVYVRYDDYSGGDRFAFDIDTLNSSIAKVDPYSQDYRLNVLYIDGLRSNFIMDTSYIVKDVDTAARLPYLAANVIDINDVSF